MKKINLLPLMLLAVMTPVAVHAANLAAVLPPGGAVKGWHQVGATRLYNRANLYDLIDGEAGAILEYAFAGCAYAQYAPAAQKAPAVTVTVYNMTNPLNAFGMFGSDRISGRPVSIGVEGVSMGSGLDFWKGPYVVRCAMVKASPAARAALTAYARATAGRIHAGGSKPALLRALPAGRKPRSEKYVRSNVLGLSFLSNAVLASYPSLGPGAEVYIAQYPNAAASRRAFEAYWTYAGRGTGRAALPGLGGSAFKAYGRFAKNVVVLQKGRYLVGANRASNSAAAAKLVRAAGVKVK